MSCQADRTAATANCHQASPSRVGKALFAEFSRTLLPVLVNHAVERSEWHGDCDACACDRTNEAPLEFASYFSPCDSQELCLRMANVGYSSADSSNRDAMIIPLHSKPGTMSTKTQTDQFSWNGFQVRSLPEVPDWIEPLGRAGYVAKGVVYGIIGVLAFKLAIGAGGKIAGSREAIQTIGQAPFGRLLLGLTSIGFLGYTAWRLVQAVKDTEGAGRDTKGIVKRIGFAVSGMIYLTLGVFAGSIALGAGASGGANGSRFSLLSSTWGQVVLGVAGVITIGVAVYFIYKAVNAKFMEKYDLAAMDDTKRKLALYAGRIGVATRGVAFAIIGGFVVSSAMRGTGGGEIAGMSDALAAIATQSYGKILLGITGLGLVCYAVHSCLTGIYRRFNIQS